MTSLRNSERNKGLRGPSSEVSEELAVVGKTDSIVGTILSELVTGRFAVHVENWGSVECVLRYFILEKSPLPL